MARRILFAELLMLVLIGGCAGPERAEVRVIGTLPDLSRETGAQFPGLEGSESVAADLDRQLERRILEELVKAGYGPNPEARVRLLVQRTEVESADPVDDLAVLVSLELVRTGKLLALAEVTGRRGPGESEDEARTAVAEGVVRLLEATHLQAIDPR